MDGSRFSAFARTKSNRSVAHAVRIPQQVGCRFGSSRRKQQLWVLTSVPEIGASVSVRIVTVGHANSLPADLPI